jgi:hypothetical protein
MSPFGVLVRLSLNMVHAVGGIGTAEIRLEGHKAEDIGALVDPAYADMRDCY